MRIVNIQQAKTHLSRLVEDAAAGEEIIIAKAGRPRVRLTPCPVEKAPRTLGGWAGRIRIAKDFDDTPADVVRLFEGTEPPARRRRR
jgi:prevent-host-death family protein